MIMEKEEVNNSSSSSSSNSTNLELVEDYFGIIKIYSNGTILRSTQNLKHKDTIHENPSVIWKDLLFYPSHNLHLRIYRPKKIIKNNPNSPNHHKSIPIIFCFHATGFCIGERSYPNQHNSSLTLCSDLHAIIISPDHRLAPENRLPAAIEDGFTAIKWLRDQVSSSDCDAWLSDVEIDFDRVFVFGDSSGGNIAHHLEVRLGRGSPELKPIRVRGYILLSPFFGGILRTKREEEKPYEDFWSQEIYDQLWKLSIPHGANLDHPLVNPFGPSSPSIEGLRLDPFLVMVGGDEVMRDRVEDYAMKMKASNHEVQYVEFEGKQHGFFASNSYLEESKDLIQLVKDFIAQIY